MIVFGITGGSGSGKTSASNVLKSLGAEIIDADLIAREVVGKGSRCLDELVDSFGDGILLADGTLNRRKLASIAFSDRNKTKTLNKITHKYIRARVKEILAATDKNVAVIDGAVIIGSDIEKDCDFIVSVIADRGVRVQRIIERDGITPGEANERLDAQPDDDFYKSHSRFIITNNGTENELVKQVEKLYNDINEV